MRIQLLPGMAPTSTGALVGLRAPLGPRSTEIATALYRLRSGLTVTITGWPGAGRNTPALVGLVPATSHSWYRGTRIERGDSRQEKDIL